MIRIEANIPFIEPPQWAILERSLIDLMNGSVDPVMERYVRPAGSVLWPTSEDFSSIDGLDDTYESFHNWPLFYLLGGGDHILEYSHRTWEGITRQFARYDTGHGHPMVVKEYEQGYDWMHQGEGYLFFYLLCMADPTNEKNLERAERYAGFYLNEDPEALNYDTKKRLIKCAHNGSMGPAYRNFEKHYTAYRYTQWKPWSLPFHDIPGIETVEDLQKPGMEEKMGQALVERMGRGDVACNLAATSMVTNAYICSGDEKYKAWVVEYTQAWIERTRQNNGILPDNVGLSGEIGEYLNGKWYGGYYGWTWPHGWHHLSDASIAAAENATVLTGDLNYMDFPRSQIDVLMQQGEIKGETLHAPHFHHDKGWDGYSPMQAHPITHIWCMSMQDEDMARLKKQRNHDAGNWQKVSAHFSKHGGGHEAAWTAYLQGEYPEYPVDILHHNHAQVHHRLAFMRDDQQDPSTYGDWYLQVRNPITVEGLVQLTMGGPLFMYNGGLLMARLRYFDVDRRRPGLPPDIAALVETLENKRAVLHLVNLHPTQGREVLLQAGVFGEHCFTWIAYQQRRQITAEEAGYGQTHEAQYRQTIQGQIEDKAVEVNDRYFTVHLEAGAEIRLDLGMERFVNSPSYALPWN
ncbi:MAG: hypothetical protein QGI86_13140 [Candidatus Poribacteria bacterium]|jgi:hypothetical protein|nr:hypothetical protein [Candidatus Poribacteria bacterium]MDP6747741.1 hypothetical protein [Candidatus Poribacteria bacterium]MDP6996506.1 hypothetical protein [Candidatus Poribacteria bacterium]